LNSTARQESIYGAVPDLQLTAVLPVGFQGQVHGPTAMNLSNVELAAKYRFLHQLS
jgi:hypothetical protein